MRHLVASVFTLSALAGERIAIIVPASLKSAANVASISFDPSGGGQTFRAALVTPPGTSTTHYWTAFKPTGTNGPAIQALATTEPFAGNVIVGTYDETDHEAPFRMILTNGLAVYAPPMN